MKKLFLSVFLLLITFFLSAHEFWLQPDKFIYERGEAITVRFSVGENFEGENWSGDTSRIRALEFYYGDVKDNLIEAMGNEKGDSVQLAVLDEGTAMVTCHSVNSFIELDSAKFNAYLLEDGLKDAIEYRKQHNETDSMGREYYQRSVKTILQIGSDYSNTFRQRTSLPLDIIPQSNPYLQENDEDMRVKIFFGDEPLKNALIKVWHRENNKTVRLDLLSDDDGEISFAINTSGEWMVSCVKMVHLENDLQAEGSQANWQSYWGSCTWGYK